LGRKSIININPNSLYRKEGKYALTWYGMVCTSAPPGAANGVFFGHFLQHPPLQIQNAVYGIYHNILHYRYSDTAASPGTTAATKAQEPKKSTHSTGHLPANPVTATPPLDRPTSQGFRQALVSGCLTNAFRILTNAVSRKTVACGGPG
jgi:hypothetical protein